MSAPTRPVRHSLPDGASARDGRRMTRRPSRVPARTPRLAEIAAPTAPPSTAWWRVAVIGAGALTLAVGALATIWFLLEPLALLFVAIVIAEALAPLVARLERWMPRGPAIGTVYLALVAILGGVGWLVAPPLVSEGTDLAVRAPELIERAQQWIDDWDPDGAGRAAQIAEAAARRFTSTLVGVPATLVSSAAKVLAVLFLSVYWLVASPRLGGWVRSLFPPARRDEVDEVLRELGWAIGGFVRGEAIAGLVVAVVVYVGLVVIGVPYALVLALVTGVAEIVPIVGPAVAGVLTVGIAFLDSPQTAFVTFILFVGVNQLESEVLIPYVMQRQADVPPVLALFAILAGGSLAGILGAIIAVPAAAAARVLVVRVVAPALRSWSGAAGS